MSPWRKPRAPAGGLTIENVVGFRRKVGWRSRRVVSQVAGLTFSQAEALLDWLESCGCTHREIRVEDAGVTVRCQCPPGMRLDRDQAGNVCLVKVETP